MRHLHQRSNLVTGQYRAELRPGNPQFVVLSSVYSPPKRRNRFLISNHSIPRLIIRSVATLSDTGIRTNSHDSIIFWKKFSPAPYLSTTHRHPNVSNANNATTTVTHSLICALTILLRNSLFSASLRLDSSSLSLLTWSSLFFVSSFSLLAFCRALLVLFLSPLTRSSNLFVLFNSPRSSAISLTNLRSGDEK